MKEKGKLTEWIAIGISIILGVASLYWNYQTQENIAKQQASIQKEIANAAIEANFAHVTLNNYVSDYGCGEICPNLVEISNSGPAIAKNVTITFVPFDITNNWGASIDDIANFSILTEPRTQEATVKMNKGKAPEKSNIEVSVNTLLPNDSIVITLQPNFPKSATKRTLNGLPTTVYIHSNGYTLTKNNWYRPISEIIYDFFRSKFSVAELEVGLTCDTCKTDQNNVYPFYSGYLTTISSVIGDDEFQSGSNPISEQNGNTFIWKGMSYIDFISPNNANSPSISSPLYILATNVNLSNEEQIGGVSECQPTPSHGNIPYCGQSN